MTVIQWYWEENGDFGILAEGHAEYHPGNDIVCSAVSALLQTLYAGLEIYCFAETEQFQESGLFWLKGNAISHTERAKTLFDSILFGLQMLTEEYPAHVSMEKMGGCRVSGTFIK